MGVERAVKRAEAVLAHNDGRPVFCLGPLIHNPAVLRTFGERGLCCVNEAAVETIPSGSKVIIRAHGVVPEVLEKATAQGLELYDATCPKVAASRTRIVSLSREGKTIIMAGDRNHGEVLSIVGFAKKENPSVALFVVQNEKEAQDLVSSPFFESSVQEKKAVLVSQTTFSPAEFSKIEAVLRQKISIVHVYPSICSATLLRQEALCALKGTVDAVLVLGGKNSANTRRLAESARTFCKNVALIEDVSEIPADFFGYETVALTAGASTPLSFVEQAENALKNGAL